MGEDLSEQRVQDIDAVLKQSYILQRVGLIVTSLEETSLNKSQMREALRKPLKDIRDMYGKECEQECLPSILMKKVQDTIALK
eukprot:6492740-Amphidinium_carterae.5